MNKQTTTKATPKLFIQCTGTGCPERCWMPHPWRHSHSGWMGPWPTWCSCRCACSMQGSWTRWPLKVPSNSNDSMIQWYLHQFLAALWEGNLLKRHSKRQEFVWGSILDERCRVYLEIETASFFLSGNCFLPSRNSEGYWSFLAP